MRMRDSNCIYFAEALILLKMERKWEEVYNYLSSGSYPPECTRGQQQTLRKLASKFSIHDGELFFGVEPHRRAIKSREEAERLFKEYHVSPMGHAGIVKTRSSMCLRFYWRGMTTDINRWVSECDQCQRVGPPPRAVETQDCIKVSAVWELIGIHLTGPLPETTSGFKYILTATDYFSRWVEAFPQKTNSADEVAKNLCTMFYRHGSPRRILTNQGQEFVNQINSRLCEHLSFGRSVTFASYHPRTNGLNHRPSDTIIRALRKFVNEKQDDWDVYLEPILFSLRSKVHSTTKVSPFLLMYGREARYPSEVPLEMPLSSIILPVDYSHYKQGTKRGDRNEKGNKRLFHMD